MMKRILNKWVLVSKNEYDNFNKTIKSLQDSLKGDKELGHELLAEENKNKRLKSVLDETRETLKAMNNDYNSLLENFKRTSGAKGGLTKKINQLSKELESTKQQLADTMTDKYLVKKIHGTKVKPQKMKAIKPMPAEVQKYIHKEIEDVRNG